MDEANGPAPDDDGADNRAGPAADADNGSNGTGGTWVDGLRDADNQSLVKAKGWDKGGPDAALAAYRNLEAHQGSLVRPPGENATEDELSAFYDRIGRPKQPDDYKFALPQGVRSDLPYDQERAKAFKAVAHANGMTARQAQAVHDDYLLAVSAAYDEAEKARNERVTKATEALVGVWGDEKGETFVRKVEMARRALSELGTEHNADLVHELTEAGLLDSEDGAVMSPGLAQAFAAIGERLYAEDSLYGGADRAGNNPFAEATLNLTAQSRVLRDDPERAKRQILAAGLSPEAYGL